MKSDAQTQQAYALYLARVGARSTPRIGITIGVHPRTSPATPGGWTQSLLVNFFKTYMGPVFARRDTTPRSGAARCRAPADANIATAVAADAPSMAYVEGLRGGEEGPP